MKPCHMKPCHMKTLMTFFTALLLWVPSTHAEEAERNWPQWRGPDHNGIAPHSDPPITWSETENIRFKVAVPGRGLASPIVWDDKIFLLTAVAADADAYQASQNAAAEKLEKKEWPPSVEPVKQAFLVIALSRQDGSEVWRRTAAEKVPHESHYLDSSWASASPVTDGERLFAHFGSSGLYAYNLDGELLWSVDLGDMKTRRGFGEGSSPALHGDTLVVNWDHEGDSFLVALDARSGKQLWRTDRPDEVTSWATPLVVESGGRHQVVVPATGRSRGYDLETGEEIWSASGMTVNTIPTPVHRNGLVYLTSGYRGNLMQAIDLAKAKGPINDTEAIAWTFDRHTPYVPSPMLYEDRICFIKHFKNIFTCLDATTGEVLYTEQRLEGITNVYASPVAAAGRFYIFAKDGRSIVLDAGKEYKVLATNVLDDPVNASPAIAGDEIFVRSDSYLYAIGSTDARAQDWEWGPVLLEPVPDISVYLMLADGRRIDGVYDWFDNGVGQFRLMESAGTEQERPFVLEAGETVEATLHYYSAYWEEQYTRISFELYLYRKDLRPGPGGLRIDSLAHSEASLLPREASEPVVSEPFRLTVPTEVEAGALDGQHRWDLAVKFSPSKYGSLKLSVNVNFPDPQSTP